MTIKEQLNNSKDYQEFINEQTIKKKKCWNSKDKFYYIPSLRYAYDILKKRVASGEDADDILKGYM